ncbi:MAG: Sir2 family NAD-dependent protein deacetylase, partial [Gammaproteobacteria bacterium]
MPDSESLIDFFQRHPKVWVLTGAGISLASGIPTYRDQHGNWQRNDPIKHWEFINQLSKRKRYWARSMVGWREMRAVSPNVVHQALTALQSAGAISQIVTQNVDGLHQSAGSRNVIDLHGRMDSVCCMDCGALSEREALQTRLETLNPELAGFVADVLPDGDADIDDYPIETVLVPECEACGGMLKPDVVFFGD